MEKNLAIKNVVRNALQKLDAAFSYFAWHGSARWLIGGLLRPLSDRSHSADPPPSPPSLNTPGVGAAGQQVTAVCPAENLTEEAGEPSRLPSDAI